MKKLILLLTLVAVSFSADKWEYQKGIYLSWNGDPDHTDNIFTSQVMEAFIVYENGTEKYKITRDNIDRKISSVQMVGLNKMGADGWEYISQETSYVHMLDIPHPIPYEDRRTWGEFDSDSGITYYFKRKIGE